MSLVVDFRCYENGVMMNGAPMIKNTNYLLRQDKLPLKEFLYACLDTSRIVTATFIYKDIFAWRLYIDGVHANQGTVAIMEPTLQRELSIDHFTVNLIGVHNAMLDDVDPMRFLYHLQNLVVRRMWVKRYLFTGVLPIDGWSEISDPQAQDKWNELHGNPDHEDDHISVASSYNSDEEVDDESEVEDDEEIDLETLKD